MILSGTASHDGRLVAAFQATSLALNDDRRISDVFTLSGVPVVGGAVTDTFTLELFVNTALDASAFHKGKYDFPAGSRAPELSHRWHKDAAYCRNKEQRKNVPPVSTAR